MTSSGEGETVERHYLLTIAEAAEFLRCKPSTLRAWFTQGKLPRVKVGRLTRVLRQDVEAFVAARRIK
jgi:excisionase family DNA binding protein